MQRKEADFPFSEICWGKKKNNPKNLAQTKQTLWFSFISKKNYTSQPFKQTLSWLSPSSEASHWTVWHCEYFMLALLSVSKDAVLSHLTQYTFQAFKYFKQLKPMSLPLRAAGWQRWFSVNPNYFWDLFVWSAQRCVSLYGEHKPHSAKHLNRYFSPAHLYIVAWHVYKHSATEKASWTRFVIFKGSLSH